MKLWIRNAAIVLLAALTGLAVMTVQLYRHIRDRNNAVYERSGHERNLEESLRTASDALRKLQIDAANYVVTGRADSLSAYNASLQDWRYEAGTLNLIPAEGAAAARVRDFLRIGNGLAGELASVASPGMAASRGAALDRLRAAAETAYRELARLNGASRKDSDGEEESRFHSNRLALHRLIYCAGGLYLLGLAEFVLLFVLLRKPAVLKKEGVTA
jgi:hypothetical protein